MFLLFNAVHSLINYETTTENSLDSNLNLEKRGFTFSAIKNTMRGTADQLFSTQIRKLPTNYQLNLLGYLSITFEEASKLAAKKGLPNGWAIRFHDASLDDYSVVKKWLGMHDSLEKVKLRYLMGKNPTIGKKLMEYLERMKRLSYKDALALATKKKIKTFWAVQAHDATKDGQQFLKEWLKMDKATPDNIKLNMIRMMLDNPTIDFNIQRNLLFDKAVMLGDINVLKALVNKGFRPTLNSFHSAIQFQNLKILKFFIEDLGQVPIKPDLEYALKTRKLDVVNYFLEKGIIPHNPGFLNFAANWIPLDMFKFLIEKARFQPNQFTIDSVIRSRNDERLQITKYLMEQLHISPSTETLRFLNQFKYYQQYSPTFKYLSGIKELKWN